jgi:hypothetical protein
MAEQIEAITGRRLRSPYRSMVTAQAAQLPELRQAAEAREFQEQEAGQRAREMTLAEEAAKTQEKQAKLSTIVSMTGTGAMIGSAVPGIGTAIGGAIGFGAGVISSIF